MTTALAIKPDWSVLELEGVERIAGNAARIVSSIYRERKVAMLAERDDMLQEARILLATRLAPRARHWAKAGSLGTLQHELVMDLRDLVKWGAEDAKNTVSLDAKEEEDGDG